MSAKRMKLLTSIVRLLITMVPQQRGNKLRETRAEYRTAIPICDETFVDDGELSNLLARIPLPALDSDT